MSKPTSMLFNHDATIVSPVEAAATRLQNPANRENPKFVLFRLLSSMAMDVRAQRMHMDWNDPSTPMAGPMPEIDLGILKAMWLDFRFWHIARWSEAKESVATRQFSMFSHGHSHQRQLLRRLKLESISTFLFQVPSSLYNVLHRYSTDKNVINLSLITINEHQISRK